MTNVKRFAVMLAAVAVVGLGASGCYVSAQPAEPTLHTNYYQPQYYNGYVVYYDSLGRPMYYNGGVAYYIPSTYMYYGRYVNHYRVHRVHYSRWYRARGYRYRRYRTRRYRRSGRVHRRGTRRTHRRTHRRKRR